MMVDLIPVVLALGSVSVAIYTDLKDRIIPNKLTYPLIVLGIAFYLGLGVYRSDFYLALFGVVGATLGFGIGYAMYLMGGWAGGDVKLFTALGALLPTAPAIDGFPLFTAPWASLYPFFPVTLFFNSVILAAPTLLIYATLSRLQGGGAFYEEVKLSEVEEGTIPAEIIYEKDGEIERRSPGPLGFLTERLGNPDWDRKLTSPWKAAGFSPHDVEVLRELVRKGKLEDRIRIKKGVPFAPAIGAGVFAAIIYGGLYWRIMLALMSA